MRLAKMRSEAADRRRLGFGAKPAPGNSRAGSVPPALPAEFFNRDPREVGPDLLGKLLVRRYRNQLLIGRVVETEAYLGALDPAAHAYAGKTARNAVLFGPPGIAYVYFIYGNHFCLNVSCMPEGDGEGVLFRALEPVRGLATMAKLRGLDLPPQLTKSHDLLSTLRVAKTKVDSLEGRPTTAGRLRLLCSGPGRLAQAMQITRQRHNGMPLTSADSELFLADDGFRPNRIATTVRVGLTKAADMPLRYVIAGNPFVSGKRV
jgi:DNA-3-methyladenine glycosylase